MKIELGFWNCCQARPTKVVAFDDDRDGAAKGALVWHYACAGCASTVHPSRVLDAPSIAPVTLAEADGTEYQLVDGWLFRRLPGASGWVPAYGYADRQARKKAHDRLVALTASGELCTSVSCQGPWFRAHSKDECK